MDLLTFAHRKEVDAFFNHYDFKLIPYLFDGLYQSSHYYLLITGEGIQNVTEKLTATLANPEFKIEKVINLGVAGSVNSNISIDSIHQIRTAYAHHYERLEFKSFSSQYIDSHFDCMTVFDRVVSLDDRKKISMFADIIDRELWAIGSVCHLFKIPFSSIKYISDDLKSENFCQLVIEQAPLISQKLLDFFITSNNELLNESPNEPTKVFTKNKSFYFTVTQKRSLDHLVNLLTHKNLDMDEVALHPKIIEIQNLELTPKEKTKLLLSYLLELINPFHKKINQQLEKILSPYKKTTIDIQHDRELESSKLIFSFPAQNIDELNRHLDILKKFPSDDIQKIFEGKFDV